jgi:hypothetical protein
MSPGMRIFFSRIFPLPFIIIGAVVLYFGCRNLQRANQSVTWPTAKGVVQNSSMEYHHGDKGGGTYHAEVMYNFTVNAATFSGNNVAFGDYDSSNPSHARDIVNRYPKGKTVSVYYDKQKPQVCVLEPGVKVQAWFLPGFGLVFFAAGIIAAVCIPKAMRAQTVTSTMSYYEKPEVIEICPPQGEKAKSFFPESDMDTSGRQTQHSGRL